MSTYFVTERWKPVETVSGAETCQYKSLGSDGRSQSRKRARDNMMVKMAPVVLVILLASFCQGLNDQADFDQQIKGIKKDIQNNVELKIEHNSKSLQKFINQSHNDTAEIYDYIDASIKNLASVVLKNIRELKNNTEDNIAALKENVKENLKSVEEANDATHITMIEAMVGKNDSALRITANWLEARDHRMEVGLMTRWKYPSVLSGDPVQPSVCVWPHGQPQERGCHLRQLPPRPRQVQSKRDQGPGQKVHGESWVGSRLKLILSPARGRV